MAGTGEREKGRKVTAWKREEGTHTSTRVHVQEGNPICSKEREGGGGRKGAQQNTKTRAENGQAQIKRKRETYTTRRRGLNASTRPFFLCGTA